MISAQTTGAAVANLIWQPEPRCPLVSKAAHYSAGMQPTLASKKLMYDLM